MCGQDVPVSFLYLNIREKQKNLHIGDIERSMMTLEKTENAIKKSFMERIVFETRVQYTPLPEIVFSGLSSDLSVGGLYLRTKPILDVKDTFVLSFALTFQGQEVSISCNARVAWTNFEKNRRKNDYPSGVGLQFLDLASEDHATLSQFVEAHDDSKKMNVVCAWCRSHLGMRKGPSGATSHGICKPCFVNLKV